MKDHALGMDGDYLVFAAMSAAEVETQWEDDVWTLECDHDKAWTILCQSIEAIRKRKPEWEGSKIVLAFTDETNWRKSVLPTYKANRKASRKPTGYRHFVERVMAVREWNSFLRPTLEGDDCLGIIATAPQIVGCKSVTICSPDKDFKTIPCEFFHMSSGEITTRSVEQADWWHMYQTIIGDTTDGYGGIKGLGETVAVEFLNNPFIWVEYEHVFKSGARKGQSEMRWRKEPKPEDMTLWQAMVTLAAKAGMTEEELLQQAQVARICRASDFNFKDKEVILWTPDCHKI